MKATRNVDGLRQNAQKKRQEALNKVEQGIRQLLKEGKPINFQSVAGAANVSKAFLYKEPDIKERVEQLRQQGAEKKPELRQKASDASKDSMIRTLRERLKKLEAENQELRKQVEVAYGLAHSNTLESIETEIFDLQKQNRHLVNLLTQARAELDSLRK